MKTIELNWTDLKTNVASRNLRLQYYQKDIQYHIFAFDGNMEFYTKIEIDSENPSIDQTDFEQNYKDNCNLKTHLTQLTPFSDTDNFFFRGMGVKGSATKSSDGNPNLTHISTQIPNQRYINGIHLMLVNQHFDDYIVFKVIDKDYLYAGILYPTDYSGIPWNLAQPNGVVLDTFGQNWNVISDKEDQGGVILDYPARILSGLYVCIEYFAHGTVEDVKVKCNYYLHEKK